jgi:hypothetical protein
MRKFRRVELQQKSRDSLWILGGREGKILRFSGLDHSLVPFLLLTLCAVVSFFSWSLRVKFLLDIIR